ncbi:MAG: FtsX-like permease family protein [Pirellula sp.]|nr:FtsX-like permease family protein [Pirellula sp.]
MFEILWQHWKQRPSRFFFTLLSIVLSTATLVGILVASHNARSSFRELIGAVQGLPSYDIVNRQGGRFERLLLDESTLNQGVVSGLPTLIRGSILRFKEAKTRANVLGIPLANSDAESRRFLQSTLEIDDSQWPHEDECLISSLIATQLNVQDGDSIQCLFRRGFRKLVIKKVLGAKEWNRLVSEHGIIVDLDWLQSATALPGQINRYRLYLADSNENKKQALVQQIESKIPESLSIKERASAIGIADDLLKSTELGLSFASALAIAMAAYILLNSTRMNLAERRPHFAILRCLGATSQQIHRAVLIEALVMSSVGVAFGLAAGCGLGFFMGRVLSSVLQSPPNPFSVPWFVLVAIAIFIPCLSLSIVWFALRHEHAVSPLESFREPVVQVQSKLPWRSILNGLILWCIALIGLYCVHREWLPPQWGVYTGLLALVSFLLWLPLGLIPLIWIVDQFVKRRQGFPMEIAKHQLIRRPDRTSLNAGFLVISLCGAVGLGQTLMSNTAEIKRWYYRALPGDLFLVSTRTPSLLIDSEDPLREMIEKLPGLNWSNAIRFIWCQADEENVLCLVREFPVEAPFPTEPKGMPTEQARQLVDSDHVFVGPILAKKLKKKAGDMLTLTVNGRSFQIEIGGVNSNFANGGLSILMKRSTAQRFFEVTGFEWYSLSIENQQLDNAVGALEAVKEQFGFELQLGTELRKGVEQAISGVTAGIWSVIFISFVTGGFGIATTLAMNTIEQARDFSLLRIVGASRGQIMLSVLVQAWLLGSIGIVFGMAGGVTTVLIIVGCSEALLGYTPEFAWNPFLMWISVIATMLIVTIAALFPAWTASQINPIEHLTYE